MMCDYTALCSTRLAVLGSELVEQSSLYLNKFHTGNTSAIYNDGDFDCKPKKEDGIMSTSRWPNQR